MYRSARNPFAALAGACLFWACVVPAASAQKMEYSTESREAVAHFTEGMLHHQNVQLTRAVESFRAAIEADPDFAMARIMAALADGSRPSSARLAEMDAVLPSLVYAPPGELLFALGMRERLAEGSVRAYPYLNAARMLAPDDPCLAMYWAQTRTNEAVGREGTRKAFEEVVEHFPDHPPALNQLAYILWGFDDLQGARDLARKHLEMAPDVDNAYDSYAEIMQASGFLDEALQYYQAYEGRAPGEGYGSLGMAGVYQVTGQGDRAREILEEALPGATGIGARFSILQGTAMSHLRDGNHAEGLEVLETLAGEASDAGLSAREAGAIVAMAHVDALTNGSGRVDEFLDRLDGSGYTSAYKDYYAAGILALAGRHEAAREAADRFRKARPGLVTNGHLIDGFVLLEAGMTEKASQVLMKTRLRSHWAQALMVLAQARLGNEANAMALERQLRDRTDLNLETIDFTLPLLLLERERVAF